MLEKNYLMLDCPRRSGSTGCLCYKSFCNLLRQRGDEAFRDQTPYFRLVVLPTFPISLQQRFVCGEFDVHWWGLHGRVDVISQQGVLLDGDDFFNMIDFKSIVFLGMVEKTFWNAGQKKTSAMIILAFSVHFKTVTCCFLSDMAGHLSWAFHNAPWTYLFGCHKNWHSGVFRT
jgi:hypothetical protein